MTDQAPFFSVVIPAYNRAGLIIDCIKSVQQQTFTNWECIVVDDGSTDNTKEVVEAIANSDARVKYVYQKNAERSAARNNGIRNSLGTYVCFLDSDDHLIPDSLQRFYNFITSHGVPKALIIAQAMIVSGTEKNATVKEDIGSNVIEYLFTHPLTPSRVCVHREILNEVNFDEDIVIVEDIILWIKIAYRYPVLVSDHVSVNYILHGENSVIRSGNGILKAYKGVLLAQKRYPEIFAQIPSHSYHGWMSRMMTNIAIHHILNNRNSEALMWCVKALLEKPAHEHTRYRLNLIFRILTGQKIEL